ncbi:MAG: hypothetical protein DWQ02_21470 [Bacteroidetes bacterium]|nr:MAG: hypothetical protein DWQ02_21470 [Bacteroidota bacterium]
MKIDLIFFEKSPKKLLKPSLSNRIIKIKSTIRECLDYEPQIFFDFSDWNPDHYYFLFYSFLYSRVSDFAPFSSNMIYMDGLWNDLEILSNDLDFLGIVHRPHFIEDRPSFFAPRSIVKGINENEKGKCLINEALLGGLRNTEVYSIKGNDPESLIVSLIDYLQSWDKLKKEIKP